MQTSMTLSAGTHRFEWIEPWADLPDSDGWAHHGFAVNRDGNLITGDAKEPRILILNPEGNLLEAFDVPVTETHGITISEENGEEILWIVDTANKYGAQAQHPVQVLKCTMDGTVLAQLTRKDFPVTEDDPFCLTACTVDPATGRLWVTDGYGSSRIFRFSPELKHELTLDGTEGEAGAFKQPHWIYADTRKQETEIYIADRGNDRIQVYSPNGRFLRCLDEGLITPSAFARFDDVLVVAELKARLLLMDIDDKIIGTLGSGHEYLERAGWPNRLLEETPVSPLDVLEKGKFNSPHGLCADASGNLYVAEWLIGNRFIQLKRLAP